MSTWGPRVDGGMHAWFATQPPTTLVQAIVALTARYEALAARVHALEGSQPVGRIDGSVRLP